jgi:hypothetical protein
MNEKPERKRKRSRETLKNYFKAGSLPREEHFHDLIDSTLNMEDEGFVKTEEDGLRLSTEAGGTNLLSFFRDGQDEGDPLWQLGFDESADALCFTHRDGRAGPNGPPTLSLSPDGRVGINTSRPERDLDVNGIVRMVGRVGVVPKRDVEGVADQDPDKPAPPVLADGHWHTITGALTACHALEVVAGVGGKPREGQYALVYAVALNTFNPGGFYLNPFGFNFLHRKNRIRIQHAFFRSRRDMIELRWRGPKERYYLEIRTRRDFGEDETGKPVRILYHVTELWPYPYMRDVAVPDVTPSAGSGAVGTGGATAALPVPPPAAALGKG